MIENFMATPLSLKVTFFIYYAMLFVIMVFVIRVLIDDCNMFNRKIDDNCCCKCGNQSVAMYPLEEPRPYCWKCLKKLKDTEKKFIEKFNLGLKEKQ